MHLRAAGLVAQAATTTTAATHSRRTRSCRRAPRSSGASSPSSYSLVLHVEVRLPGGRRRPCRRAPRGSASNLDEARAGPHRGRADPGRLPAPAGRRPQRVQPHHRGGPPGGRAVRQDMMRRADEEVAELRRRNAGRPAVAQERVISQLQNQVRALAIELAEKVDRGQPRPRPEHDPGRPVHRRAQRPARRPAAAGLIRWPTPEPTGSTPTPPSAVRDGQGRGRPRRPSRTSCSRWPGPIEANETLRATLGDAAIPIERAPGRGRDLLGGRASPITTALGVVRGRRRPGPGPARDHRQAGRPGRRASATRRSPRCAPPTPSTRPAASGSPTPSAGPPASMCRSR